ncbi:MAG: ROK family transcriptional regulator [Microbacterium sp.]|jgi:predicted NBD/HSP70 family sugar kinase|nr:ROK family transcriptional regulator [Microbacterium sp.]
MESTIVGTARLKRQNTGLVLGTLRAADRPMRIAEVAAETALTRATVATIVDALERDGWVSRHAPEGALGRPALRYGIDPSRVHVIGLDLGLHRIVVELADAAGEVLARRSEAHDLRDGDALLALANANIDAVLTEAGLAREDVLRMTVGAVGMIDRGAGRVREVRGIRALTELDLTDELGRGVRGVDLDNDADLAAMAMTRLDGAPASFLTVQWGERLGAGLVLDGRLYRGPAGAAGELGGLPVVDPWSGSPSQLEQVVGANRVSEVAARGQGIIGLFDAVARGDAEAAAILDEVAGVVAAALAPVLLALDLHDVFITGGMARGGETLTAALERRLGLLGPGPRSVQLSPFLEDTVVRGATEAALRSAWSEVLEGRLGGRHP